MSNIKAVEVYKTTDGKVYEDRHIAEMEQLKLDKGDRVEEYLTSVGAEGQAAARQRNTINSWLAWDATTPELVTPTPPDVDMSDDEVDTSEEDAAQDAEMEEEE
ncbi:MAG: hypothetical protein GQ570_03530 [Helicobacteraceae bacterium]|nr:hypothetical protein [Helicobacteraceae bacterium]